MTQGGVIIIFLSVMMFSGPGCTWEPGLDKNKFSELNRTAQELRASLRSDKPCDVPDTLVQRLASETAALKDKAASKAERDVLAAYSRLMATYKDGLLLCRYRDQLHQFQFVPRGRIYVSQELDPLVEKYGLSTERHLYEPTGAYWRSIEGDSIWMIWESAEAQTKNIENMINYN